MRRLCLALVVLAMTACSGDLVSRRTQAMIDRELETARLSGFQAQFVTASTDLENERIVTRPRPPNVTLLVLRPSEGRLYPASDLTHAFADREVDERVHRMVASYLAYEDLDGAARALVRVYSELLRTRAGYHPTRALAPLLPPEPARFRPLETAHWGVSVALLTALLGIRVLLRRQSGEQQK